MSRLWGRSVKYALWAISRERCVVMGQNIYTNDTRRLVFTDLSKMVIEGLIGVDVNNQVTLTTKGQSLVPTDISTPTRVAALKFFLPGVSYVFDDGHVQRKDGTPGKVSRFVAEVLLSKGVLRQSDVDQTIHLVDGGSTRALGAALWTLSNEDCYVINDVLRARSDDRVVHSDAHWLEVNSYIDRYAKLTDYGRRLVPKGLGYATIKQTMAAFEASTRWQFQGSWVVGENEGRLPRYTIERLIQIGKLQIDTGGYVVKAEERMWYKCHLTASEYARNKDSIKLELLK